MLATLIRIFIAVIKYHNQKQLREGRIYFISQLGGHIIILRKVRARTQERNLEAESRWTLLTGLLLMTCSACFLIAPMITCGHHP